MRLIGILNEHDTVPCATCNHHWDVRYLVNDLGRHRLRAEGFAYIWFDDGAILVNCCPSCDVPAVARLPTQELHVAA